MKILPNDWNLTEAMQVQSWSKDPSWRATDKNSNKIKDVG